jgi:hypothetical protein
MLRVFFLSRWRRSETKMRYFFLFLLAFVVVNFIISRFINFGVWSFAVVFGEFALLFIVDRIFLFLTYRSLWKKLTSLRALYASNLKHKEDVMIILETCTFQYLSAMASWIQKLTEDQRAYAVKAKRFPGSCTAQAMVINNLVAYALKDFWRVHWLARNLGVDVYSSWKHYVLPDDVD